MGLRSSREFEWSIAASAVLCCSVGHAQCLRYTVDIIQPPSCQFFFPPIGVAAISESGELAGSGGSCNNTQSAFAWFGASPLSYLPFPAGMSGNAVGINTQRQIVGGMGSITGGGNAAPFFFQNGVLTTLQIPIGDDGAEAAGINDSGTICGYSMKNTTGLHSAVVWKAGIAQRIDVPFGPNSTATDISANGLVCGWMGQGGIGATHAFLYDTSTGMLTDIGTVLPKATLAHAKAVNSIGNICGDIRIPCDSPCGAWRGFFWSNGAALDLGVLPGFDRTSPFDLNDSNIIVGGCETHVGDGTPFLWQNGVMHKLSDLIHPPMNIRITTAAAINNAGQIAAYGMLLENGFPYVALRLNPIPPLPADITCDWRVNAADILEVIRHWGQCPPPPPLPLEPSCPADLNGDNRVGVPDLLRIISHWSP